MNTTPSTIERSESKLVVIYDQQNSTSFPCSGETISDNLRSDNGDGSSGSEKQLQQSTISGNNSNDSSSRKMDVDDESQSSRGDVAESSGNGMTLHQNGKSDRPHEKKKKKKKKADWPTVCVVCNNTDPNHFKCKYLISEKNLHKYGNFFIENDPTLKEVKYGRLCDMCYREWRKSLSGPISPRKGTPTQIRRKRSSLAMSSPPPSSSLFVETETPIVLGKRARRRPVLYGESHDEEGGDSDMSTSGDFGDAWDGEFGGIDDGYDYNVSRRRRKANRILRKWGIDEDDEQDAVFRETLEQELAQVDAETTRESVQQYVNNLNSNFQYAKSITVQEFLDDQSIVDRYMYQLGLPLVITGFGQHLSQFIDAVLTDEERERQRRLDNGGNGKSVVKDDSANSAKVSNDPEMEKQNNDNNNNSKRTCEKPVDSDSDAKLKAYRRFFDPDFLRHWHSDLPMNPRDNQLYQDLEGWSLGKYIDYCRTQPEDRPLKRLYGKDVTCPDEWVDFLFNNPKSRLPDRFLHKKSADIFTNLPEDLQAITLMFYIGIDGTNTPGHKDICGTLGHNLMVYAEKKNDNRDDDAYSLWCMFSSHDHDKVTRFFANNGGALDEDNYFMPIHKLAKADFPVYIVDQREGDFVLVPPNSGHQVLNRNGISIKVAWNTMTVSCLPFTHEVLEVYRKFAKRQIYRIKAMEYYTMKSLVRTLSCDGAFPTANDKLKSESELDAARKQLWELHTVIKYVCNTVFKELIHHPEFNEDGIESYYPEESKHSRICDICKCDIFNRCFHCRKCDSEDHGIDFCLGCVAQLRHCHHSDSMTLHQCISLDECNQRLTEAMELYENLRQRLMPLLESSERPQTAMGDGGEEQEKPPKWFPPPVDTFAISHEQRAKHERSIGTIAFEAFITRKQFPLQQQQQVECHQCRERRGKFDCMQCSDTDKYYCRSCLWHRYSLTWVDCRRHIQWKSPLAEGVCNCAPCLAQRNVCIAKYAQSVLSHMNDLNTIEPFHSTAVVLPEDNIVLDSVADFPPSPHRLRVEKLAALAKSSRGAKPADDNEESDKDASTLAFLPPDAIRQIELDKLNEPKQSLLVISSPNSPRLSKSRYIDSRSNHSSMATRQCHICSNFVDLYGGNIVHQKLQHFLCDSCFLRLPAADQGRCTTFDYQCDHCMVTILGCRYVLSDEEKMVDGQENVSEDDGRHLCDVCFQQVYPTLLAEGRSFRTIPPVSSIQEWPESAKSTR